MTPVILESPDGKFFRRIDADGSFWDKRLGLPWKRHDPPTISEGEAVVYVDAMISKLGWKARFVPNTQGVQAEEKR